MTNLNKLNKEQQKAATHVEGPILILAGAGSGKTNTMIHRMAYMMNECAIDPYNILAVTFTNKAAGEMRDRVEALTGYSVPMWILTFHAACLRILRKHGEVLGYSSSFVVYDPVDTKAVVKGLIKSLDIDDKKFTVNGCLAMISDCKEKDLSPKQYSDEIGGEYRSDILHKVYEGYEKILKKNNAMDFDDLLRNAVHLFRKDKGVLRKYKDRFRYIMVDEYQDTNRMQYEFLKLLSQDSSNICVVGDEDQCIYQWRGADIGNILNFEKDFPGARVIKLEQNYRSTGNILAAAHSVIANNKQRKAKKLWTSAEEGPKVVYRRAEDEKDEAHYVAQEIDRMQSLTRAFSDFAILYRTNAQSRTFEEALSLRNIPYRVIGGTRYYDRKEIKDLVAYMRLVNNPFDDLAMIRIINEPKRGMGAVTLGKLRALSEVRNESIFDTLMDRQVMDSLPNKAKQSVEKMLLTLAKLHDSRENKKVSDIYDELLVGTGYMKALEDAGTVESEGRLENLLEFKTVIFNYEEEGALSLSDFLEKIALLSDVDNHEPSENAVVLMTLHSAKGLEFPVVFIPGMEDGLFPGWRSMEEECLMEEERRLCYVGMTRAKERLCLTGAAYRILYGRGDYTRESTFMRELDPKLLDGDGVYQKKMEVRLGEKKTMDGYKSSQPFVPFRGMEAAKKQIKKSTARKVFVQGDRVSHEKFGQGLVVEVRGNVISVMFDSCGMKKLAGDVAPLNKI